MESIHTYPEHVKIKNDTLRKNIFVLTRSRRRKAEIRRDYNAKNIHSSLLLEGRILKKKEWEKDREGAPERRKIHHKRNHS
jgi:hypothetical protein